MTVRRAAARTALTAGLALGLAVPLSLAGSVANADPHDPQGDAFVLTCGNTSYDVVTAGNGDWTPAHDTNSNKTFIPHTFTGFHGVLRDASGAVVETFDDPPTTQGSGKQKNDVSCTFSLHEVSDGSDPEFPLGYTFDITGGVTGQIAGH